MDDKKKDKLKGKNEFAPPDFKNQKEEPDPELDEAAKDSRDELDQLEQPGGLQVEDMPESNELQERRRKTKNRLSELANMKEAGQLDTGEEPFEEESGLFDLLREANLSKRHLKFCCGGILGLFLLVTLFFGGRALWKAWQNRPDEPEDEPEVEESTDEFDFLDPSIMSGILVGEDVAEQDEALQAGENLGQQETSEASASSLTESMVDFASIYEAMLVNVNELLSQSNERRETLEDYNNELHYLLYLGEQNVEGLEEENKRLVAEFEALEEEKAASEEHFFSELKDLDAYSAAAALEAFTEDAQEIVRLRAQYNARQKLLSYYEQVLAGMELRIRDMELNEEALIKGVQVVDLEGSDLDLIIDEDEL